MNTCISWLPNFWFAGMLGTRNIAAIAWPHSELFGETKVEEPALKTMPHGPKLTLRDQNTSAKLSTGDFHFPWSSMV